MADNVDAPKAEQEPQEKPEGATQEDGGGGGDAPAEGEGAGDGEGEAKPAEDKLRQFVFDDEKPKKKAKKAKPKPVPRPTRREYETTITDLNGILAQLRRKAVKLDDKNYEHNQKLVETHELDKEVSEHLKRVEKKRLETVTYEENYQLEIIKKRKELEQEAQARIKELKIDYNQTEKQFLGEIEMLNYKFRTLCTFSDGGDVMLNRMSNLETEYKESERAFKDHLYEMQQRNVVIRKHTDDEAKARFNRIIDDFTQSREVRNAAYTRRLLNENSTLRRKYNKLIPINLKKEHDLIQLMAKTSVVKETHAVVSDITKRLENTQIKRNELLEKLQKSYKFYKLHVVTGSKYRKMFEAVKEHEKMELSKYHDKQVLFDDIAECTTALHEKYRALKEAEHEYLYQRQKYDLFVDSVKDATFSLCGLLEYDNFYPKSFGEYVAKRDGIVRGLVDLLTLTDRPIDSKAMLKAKYYKGYLGFMPLDYALCRILQEKCYENKDDLKWVPSFCQRAMKFNLCNEEAKPKSIKSSDPAMLCVKK